jgi:phosphohistidine phosphatase
MKRLYLLRHAKSDWGEPGLPDHDRPLAPRGRKAAPLVASYMAENALRPSFVLVSSALRALQTFESFKVIALGATVKIEPAVYGADVDDLMDLVRAVPAEHDSVMLVGHNPTMQDLVLRLASDGLGLEAARAKFPTAALAVLDVNVDGWAEVGPGTATLTDFVTPMAL